MFNIHGHTDSSRTNNKKRHVKMQSLIVDLVEARTAYRNARQSREKTRNNIIIVIKVQLDRMQCE